MSKQELDKLFNEQMRAGKLAADAAKDVVRAELTLEVLRVKKLNLTDEAMRIAREYQRAAAAYRARMQ